MNKVNSLKQSQRSDYTKSIDDNLSNPLIDL